ncbi:DUF3325 domain-containing protein [Pseudomonas cichorii]|uniref:DUF3325 domain-containing protein n=1 Tax=Pseudomonas cichorii TaxID=36746 RepID=UPI001C893782|nr:DUF3325 domain-containing protein [Pseudomonas cichorii]MBX8487039.1 DUF3325 domain-containing protein [Pseudomonas cichorii]
MLLAAVFCYIGFTALCLSMSRHYGELLSGPLTPRRSLLLKLAGWLLLAVSSAVAVNDAGWGVGLAQWFAVLMGCAVLLVFLMPFKPRWVVKLAGFGLVLCPFAAFDLLPV